MNDNKLGRSVEIVGTSYEIVLYFPFGFPYLTVASALVGIYIIVPSIKADWFTHLMIYELTCKTNNVLLLPAVARVYPHSPRFIKYKQ